MQWGWMATGLVVMAVAGVVSASLVVGGPGESRPTVEPMRVELCRAALERQRQAEAAIQQRVPSMANLVEKTFEQNRLSAAQQQLEEAKADAQQHCQ